MNHHKLLSAVIGVWLFGFTLGVEPRPCPAEDSDQQGERAESLADIGMTFEHLRALPALQRRDAMTDLDQRLATLFDRGVDKRMKSAAYFLSGEINYSLGNYSRSTEAFRKAGKEDKSGKFRDEATAFAIEAMEAAGSDEKAAHQWKKWRKKYKNSPLMPEVVLAQAWNALRRDKVIDATNMLDALVTSYPWMEKDSRTVLARSVVAYYDKRFDDVATRKSGAATDAAAVYLQGLVHEARGKFLEAAAKYQEVVQKFPDSDLREPAMLAKANIFLDSGAYKSAAEEFGRISESAVDSTIKAEAELRWGASLFLDGDSSAGMEVLRGVTVRYDGSDVAARAQMLLSEIVLSELKYEEAIAEFNKVLTKYFQHEYAASAQYRVGRCLDALGRHKEATSSYMTVVSGYPLAAEAPAAAYLAGAGLLEQKRPMAAVRYFQLVLDRYAQDGEGDTIEFASADHQELVEASLCLLELSFHRAGNLGQLSGVPHLMLQKMPASDSQWRAYALLIDADALAAQARYDEAQTVLEKLIAEFPDKHSVGIPANRLLAWTFAQQGKDDLAVETEQKMVMRYGSRESSEDLSTAYLNMGHIFFNKKKYVEASKAYEEFITRYPNHEKHILALYQAGLCYVLLNRDGDAVDRWEELVALNPAAAMSEKAWLRAGGVYFQAGHYEDAKRCYQGLVDNFANSRTAALGLLRLAQCDYNAGRDAEALEMYSEVIARFPDHALAKEARTGMEQALYRLGQSDGGTAVLAQLIERFPTSSFAADAQFEIAMRSYESKQYAQAADEFRRVISQFPGYSAADRAHFLMSDSYTRAEQDEKARMGYEQFLIFFPESEYRTTAQFRLGAIRFDSEDYMQAAIDYTAVISDPSAGDLSVSSLFNLALCQRMLGQGDEARESFEKYRSKYPADKRAAAVAHQLGDIHEAAGRFEMAAEEYKLALKANPGDALAVELNYRLGACREQLSNPDRALSAYRKAMASKLRSDPYRLSAVARIAALYEGKGNYSKALVAYRDLIKYADDPGLIVAAKERADELEAISKQ